MTGTKGSTQNGVMGWGAVILRKNECRMLSGRKTNRNTHHGNRVLANGREKGEDMLFESC